MVGRIIRGSVIGILLGITCGVAIARLTHISDIYQDRDNEVLASEVEDVLLRLHVKANSNSDRDLCLKYDVRDAVLECMRDELKDCESLDEAERIVYDNLDMIEEVVVKTVNEEGFDYPVKVYLTNDHFPTRQYGEMVIPAGCYDALRIDIGEGSGENFWCLLYPTLCYTVDSGAVVTTEGEKEIEKQLDEEAFEKLFVKHSVPKSKVKVKFKLLEMAKEWFD